MYLSKSHVYRYTHVHPYEQVALPSLVPDKFQFYMSHNHLYQIIYAICWIITFCAHLSET